MQDEVTIYYRTHKHMKLHEWIQPYASQIGFLHINYLKHIKLDHVLIHELIELWRRKTNTFYFRHKKRTPTLQKVAILFGLPINEWAATSTWV
jgi:aryl carrier-like protein